MPVKRRPFERQPQQRKTLFKRLSVPRIMLEIVFFTISKALDAHCFKPFTYIKLLILGGFFYAEFGITGDNVGLYGGMVQL
jgi:hypothetical protein